jgi:hypothetical protein
LRLVQKHIRTLKLSTSLFLQLVKVEGNEYDIIFVDQYMASTTKQLLGTETTRELRAKGCQSVICTFFVLFLPSVLCVEPLKYFNLFCFFYFLSTHSWSQCQRFRISIFGSGWRWLYHEGWLGVWFCAKNPAGPRSLMVFLSVPVIVALSLSLSFSILMHQ